MKAEIADASAAEADIADRIRPLDALYRTATDIIAAISVDEVLEAAVQRAQRVLASDLAYVSAYDEERGEIYVRASVGDRSATFGKISVPLGAGLGGVVAQQRSSYATRDYLTDKRLRHMPRVDRDIGAEGIRAMVGVPLLVRGRFTGALFAADRRPRDYTDEEIEHLEALGALLAVALENARMLEDREKAFAEMKAAYEALRSRSVASERLAATHEKIKQAVLQRSLPQLLEDVSADLDLDLQFVGKALNPVAGTERRPLVDPFLVPRAALHAAIEASARSASGQIAGMVGSTEVWVFATAVAGLPSGALLATARNALIGSDQRTLEEASYAAALILASEREARRARGRARTQLMQQLMEEDRSSAARSLADAEGLDIDLGQPMTLAALPLTGPAEEILRERAPEIAEERSGLFAEHRDAMLLLLPSLSKEALAALRERLGEGLAEPVALGWSHVARPLDDLGAAVREALNCLKVMRSLGLNQVAGLSDLGLQSLLLRGSSQKEIAEFMRQSLGEVLGYDLRHGTGLVDTLAAFFATGQNASQAAQKLGIHQKTMVQRLDRLGQLLGPGWRTGDRVLAIQLALHIRMLGLTGEPANPESQEKLP